MLALIGNLSLLELVVIAVVAVLIFGRRLPEVAGQAAAQFMKAKRALTDLRRETGIDAELRRAREVAYEAARVASTKKKPGSSAEPQGGPTPRLVPPASTTAARTDPSPAVPAPGPEPATESDPGAPGPERG